MTQPLATARPHLIQTMDDVDHFKRWLSTRDVVALDTETSGLSKETDRVRLVQIGDDMDGWAIPFERWGGIVEEVSKRYTGTYICHHATFDVGMLAHEGIQIPQHKVEDTMIMAHVVSSTGPLALKSLAQKHVDPAAGAAQQALDDALGKNGGWTWATIPITFQPYWLYGCLDPILTFRLRQYLKPLIMQTAPASYELEMQVAWICERMARKGVAVNRPYTQGLADSQAVYIAAVEKWCWDNYKIKPGSNIAVSEILLRDGAMVDRPGKPLRRTMTGRLTLDAGVLGPIDHPLAQAVLGRRKSEKLLSTYLSTYLDDSQLDGRIHPNINTIGGRGKDPFNTGGQSGVRTSRMSSDHPNLQNVPIHTAAAKTIRNCFVPRCDASCGCGQPHTWIKCDFDQIEMRIFGHLAQDPKMIGAFAEAARTGVDMFTASAREIFNDPTMSKNDEHRQHTKNAFYAKLYSAGVDRFAATAGINDIHAAAQFLARLDQTYPGIRRLQTQIEALAIRRLREEGEAYITSPLTGRKLVADRGRNYTLGNYLIQGMAGEILKRKIVEADKAGLGEYMILPVHDEIDLDVPPDQVNDVKEKLRDVMNDYSMLTVPITSTMSVGQAWGSVEDV